MNPSTALATVLVDELVRGGVREAVLCPGSRNAPLAFGFPGLILIVLDAWFLLRRYIPDIDMSWLMPCALIVIGLVLVMTALARSRSDG